MTDERIKKILKVADDAHDSEYEELLLAFQQIWPQFDWSDAIMKVRKEKPKIEV